MAANVASNLVEAHDPCDPGNGLSSYHIRPAAALNLPGTVDQAKGFGYVGKIGPGSLCGHITIPGAGFFYRSVFNGIDGSRFEVLKAISKKLVGNIGAIEFKIGDPPLATHHRIHEHILFDFFNGFLAATQE